MMISGVLLSTSIQDNILLGVTLGKRVQLTYNYLHKARWRFQWQGTSDDDFKWFSSILGECAFLVLITVRWFLPSLVGLAP